jgi:neutral ceramidase
MAFAVSMARVEITPSALRSNLAILGGFASGPPRLATSTVRPLYARCIVLWDSGSPKVVVSVEALASSRYVDREIRRRIAALGVPDSDLILAATHTHNGPALDDRLDPVISYCCNQQELEDVRDYTERLIETLTSLIGGALSAAPAPCTLTYGEGTATFSTNRAGLPYALTRVPVLLARNAANVPIGILYGYGCHPVAADAQNYWDSDYPGEASRLLEAAYPGATALFLLGCAGDQNPAQSGSDTYVRTYGQQIAQAVQAVATGHTTTPVTSPVSAAFAHDLALPLDVTATASNMAAVRASYSSRLANSADVARRLHAARSIQYVDSSSFPTSVPNAVQRWRFGGLQLMALGGEVVSGYDVWAHNRYGTSPLWVAAYASGTSCYVPSNGLLANALAGGPGGYEAGIDSDYPGIAGGSMVYYCWPAHFKGGTGGVEDTMLGEMSHQLS